MTLLAKVQKIAQEAHRKQYYVASGKNYPYYQGHLEPVAKLVQDMGYGEKTIATAYLHDILEDTDLTEDELAQLGVPNDVVAAIVALTHNSETESLTEYIARLCLVRRAIPVKFADSTHNLQTTLASRNEISSVDYSRRKAKYEYNLKKLKPLLPIETELSD